MNKEELSNLKVSELKEIAKEKQIDISGLKKDEIIFKLTEKEEKKTENTYPVETTTSQTTKKTFMSHQPSSKNSD